MWSESSPLAWSMMSSGTWVKFFNEIRTFVERIQHQYKLANVNFCEYVVDRLETVLSSCRNLLDRIHSADEEINVGTSQEHRTCEELKDNLEGLIACLQYIHGKRLEYEDIATAETFRHRYHVETTNRGRGRPSFNISKEQLLHLSSLHFNWSEIYPDRNHLQESCKVCKNLSRFARILQVSQDWTLQVVACKLFLQAILQDLQGSCKCHKIEPCKLLLASYSCKLSCKIL